MFNKILIANRGEIACRIIQTAQRMGIRCVAVYSDADANAHHVALADEAFRIGPAPSSESYLRSEKIIEIAKQSGAQAIHPGYGFLSENTDFAEACEANNLVFIGPPSSAIAAMGSKSAAKIIMEKAGVPLVPGYHGDDQSPETLRTEAEKCGFPLLLKAVAGGGGKGMRVVENIGEFDEALAAAKREAKNSFGNPDMLIERYLTQPRHVEIQVFCDQSGHGVYLAERDCSVQRRHQKVLEEAPAPGLSEETRKAMGETAVKAAQAINYVGAGTVEFLYDVDGSFFFMEMNTRLQVEHPVTELITGQDLVSWQMTVAEGLPLPLAQDDIELNGHAIEVRLYAEDPSNGFTPQTGPLHIFKPAEGEGLRFDTGVRSGDEVTPHYDPMLAKVIVWGENRDEARRRLIRALEDTTVFGVTTNRYFLSRIIADSKFGAGEATTAFLQQEFSEDPSLQPAQLDIRQLALAACVLAHGTANQQAWSNAPATITPMKLNTGESTVELLVHNKDNVLFCRLGDQQHEIVIASIEESALCIIDNGIRQRCQYHRDGDSLYLQAFGESWSVTDLTHQPASGGNGAGSGRIQASMDGAIIDVLAEAGQTVRQGDTLVVLEAMKMEHPVKADCDGVVSEILTQKGDQVKRKQLLVEITTD